MTSAKYLLIRCAVVILAVGVLPRPGVHAAAAAGEPWIFHVKAESFIVQAYTSISQQQLLIVVGVAAALALIGAALGLLWSVQLRRKVDARTAALRLSDGKLHALLDNTQQLETLLDMDGRIVETNRTALEFSGTTREQVLGKALWGTPQWRHSAEAQEQLRSSLKAIVDGAATAGFNTRQPNAQAVVRDLEYCMKAVKNEAGQLSFIVVEGRDVSAHKEAERALRASEANLLALIENTHASIWSVDREYRYLTFNSHFREAMSERLGRSPEIGRSVEEIPPSDDAKHWRLLYDRAFAGEQFTVDFPVATISGMRQLQASFNPIRTGGAITGACIFSHDVTDYQRAAEALRQSEERTRLIIESSLDAVIGLDAAGQILHWNTQAERIFGWSRNDVAGRALQETIFAHHLGEDGPVGLDDVLGEGAQADSQRRAETTAQRRDGKIFPVEVSTAAVQLGAGLARTAFVRDITDRRRLEWQLRQSQKMEAIGQLAGGVAHDFNNLLTVIQGNASLVQEGDLPAETTESALQEIVTATDRAAGLTRQLLTFSRQQVVQTDDLELNEIVSNMTRMLRRLIGEHITLQTQFASGSTLVRADAGMLEQIVLNLSVNARDAMPGGGHLSLRTTLVEIAEQAPELPPQARPGRFVRLDVSDTGTGIAAEDLPHIFEPFFTTKEVGRGTGLGLATVFGIVEQHHGWVDVDSTIGKGTCFSVYLPQPERALKIERKEEAPAATSSGGSETILLVEDEESVRVILSTMLRRQGYRVIEARNGEAALELWPGVRDEVDLLLTDMIMPQGVSGHDLAQRLSAEKPQLKIVYSSGYSSDVFRGDIVLPQGVAFLHKPYRAEVLLQTIRHSLDSAI